LLARLNDASSPSRPGTSGTDLSAGELRRDREWDRPDEFVGHGRGGRRFGTDAGNRRHRLGPGAWDLGAAPVDPGVSRAVLQSGDSLTGLTGSDWADTLGTDKLSPSW